MDNNEIVFIANQKFMDGDGISDKELEVLLDHYQNLHGLIKLQRMSLRDGEMYRLFELDIKHNLHLLERFKENRGE